ncbi:MULTISPECIES: GntR family transcriptional regulator [Paraburkholderia]|nr:GntR family transcriptional regulator [Paraburkholderia podalyriae]
MSMHAKPAVRPGNLYRCRRSKNKKQLVLFCRTAGLGMSDVDTRLTVRAKGARELASYLEQAIRSGRFLEGLRLPPEPDLSEEFGASRGALRRVLADLKERGLIRQTVGSGTFVLQSNRITPSSCACSN